MLGILVVILLEIARDAQENNNPIEYLLGILPRYDVQYRALHCTRVPVNVIANVNTVPDRMTYVIRKRRRMCRLTLPTLRLRRAAGRGGGALARELRNPGAVLRSSEHNDKPRSAEIPR